MSRICFIFFAFLATVSVTTEGHLIQGTNQEPLTKEILVPHDDQTEAPSAIDAPLDVVNANNIEVLDDKKCAAIGEFCMYHSDCCTNACLGYMKRCVT